MGSEPFLLALSALDVADAHRATDDADGAALGADAHRNAIGKRVAALRHSLARVGEHRTARDDDLVPLVPGAAALADGVSVHVGVRLQNAAVDIDVSRASLARRGDRVRRTLGGGGNAVIERVGKLIGGRRGVLGVMRPRAASDVGAMG